MANDNNNKSDDLTETLLHEGSFQFTDETYAKVLANYNRDICNTNFQRIYDPNMTTNLNLNVVKVEELILDNQVSISITPQCNPTVTFAEFSHTIQHQPKHSEHQQIAEITPIISSISTIPKKEQPPEEIPITPPKKSDEPKGEPKNLLKEGVDVTKLMFKYPRTPNFKYFIYHNPLEYYNKIIQKKCLEFKDCNLEPGKDFVINLPKPVDESSNEKRAGSYECLICKPTKKVRFFVSKNGAMITTNVMNHLNRHFHYKED